VWLLVCDPVNTTPDQRPSERVEHTWNAWTELTVTPLSASESIAKGIRIENLDAVPGLRAAIAA
jgi:phosphomevalonate kinase